LCNLIHIEAILSIFISYKGIGQLVNINNRSKYRPFSIEARVSLKLWIFKE
jgi:hypothetical protein